MERFPSNLPHGLPGMERRPKKFLDHVHNAVGLKYYSIRTEGSSVTCTKRLILFHNMRHPNEMASIEHLSGTLGFMAKLL